MFILLSIQSSEVCGYQHRIEKERPKFVNSSPYKLIDTKDVFKFSRKGCIMGTNAYVECDDAIVL